MKKTMLPLLACLLAGGTAMAQNTATDTDTQIGTRPQVRVFSHAYAFGTGGFLGIHPVEVDDAIATKYGMSEPYGALLNKVEENTAASKAGLQAEDIIVEWNGTRVESAAMLRRMIGETPVGRKASIAYIRKGTRATAEATLGEHPATKVLPNNFLNNLPNSLLNNLPPNGCTNSMPKKLEDLQEMIDKAPRLGMIKMMVGDGRMGATLQSITPQLATYFGVSEQSGALVGSVRDGSAAQKGGLQVGDVVISVDGQSIANPSDVARAISEKKATDKAELVVIRDKKETTLQITFDTPPTNQEFAFPDMDFTFPDMNGSNGGIRIFKDLPPNMQFTTPEGDIQIRIVPPSGNDEQAPNASGTDQPDLGSRLIPWGPSIKAAPNRGGYGIHDTSPQGRDI